MATHNKTTHGDASAKRAKLEKEKAERLLDAQKSKALKLLERHNELISKIQIVVDAATAASQDVAELDREIQSDGFTRNIRLSHNLRLKDLTRILGAVRVQLGRQSQMATILNRALSDRLHNLSGSEQPEFE